MKSRRETLNDSARLLQVRLRELEQTKVTETQRPMREVAVQAVREELTNVGRKLSQLDF